MPTAEIKKLSTGGRPESDGLQRIAQAKVTLPASTAAGKTIDTLFEDAANTLDEDKKRAIRAIVVTNPDGETHGGFDIALDSGMTDAQVIATGQTHEEAVTHWGVERVTWRASSAADDVLMILYAAVRTRALHASRQ